MQRSVEHMSKKELDQGLNRAVKEESLKNVKAYLSYGADMSYEGKRSRTSLHVAARKGNYEITKLLIDTQRKRYKKKYWFDDFLVRFTNYFFFFCKDVPQEELFVDDFMRMFVNQLDSGGNTALDLAISLGNQEVQSLLVQEGAQKGTKKANGHLW